MKPIHALLIIVLVLAIGFWAGASFVSWQHRFYPSYVNTGICTSFDVINERCIDIDSSITI